MGRNLTERLVKNGWDISVITRGTSFLGPLESVKSNINIFCHDSTTESLCSFLDKARPDIIFHLASLFLSSHKTEDVEPLIRSNILFGTQVLEAAAKTGIGGFVNVGTYWQHFDNADYNPVCLYAASKQAFVDILRFYVETTSLKAITLELYDTYGPGDPRPKLLNILKNAAQKKQALDMSAGEQKLDMVYIDDVIDAFVIAAKRLTNNKAEKYETFGVYSGKPMTLRQIVAEFERAKDLTLNIQWGKRPYRDREIMTPPNRTKKLIGWEPKVSLQQGLKNV
ncbi:MAG: NAD(P)-dependent oxidoreductase [Sedimentisphaerales bacterium]|nr:NAD(P)-dependent oxidoreductase [Sedimentisphaerales bacterium]